MLTVLWIIKTRTWRLNVIEWLGRLMGSRYYGALWRYMPRASRWFAHEKRCRTPSGEQQFDWRSTGTWSLRASLLATIAQWLGAKGTNWCPWTDAGWMTSPELQALREAVE